jgi:hypothetical protein
MNDLHVFRVYPTGECAEETDAARDDEHESYPADDYETVEIPSELMEHLEELMTCCQCHNRAGLDYPDLTRVINSIHSIWLAREIGRTAQAYAAKPTQLHGRYYARKRNARDEANEQDVRALKLPSMLLKAVKPGACQKIRVTTTYELTEEPNGDNSKVE